ncbi:MAG: response regulator [Deltaproteobacteria bacterium]|nr:response regulator [Deltaproteobacteria bacterium]
MSSGPILLVEDDPDDADLTLRALRRARILNQLVTVPTADQALVLLQRQQYADPHNPAAFSFVLLDLNLPGMGGRGLLDAMHNDRRLSEVPIVVLTSSDSTIDRLRSYKRGALAFLEKPIQVPELLRVLGDLSDGGIYVVRNAA